MVEEVFSQVKRSLRPQAPAMVLRYVPGKIRAPHLPILDIQAFPFYPDVDGPPSPMEDRTPSPASALPDIECGIFRSNLVHFGLWFMFRDENGGEVYHYAHYLKPGTVDA